MNKRNGMLGGLMVAVSAVAFGVMPILAKLAYETGINAQTLLFFRFFGAAVCMFALVFFNGLPFPTGKEIVVCLLLGGIGYAGQSFCYFTALNYASSGVVSLLLYTYPALVMIGSVLVFKESVTFKKVLSLVLALGGAFVIIGAEFDADILGIVLSVTAALIYTVYILVSSKAVGEGKEAPSSAFIMLGAAAVYGMLNAVNGFQLPLRPIGWLYVALIAVVCTVLALWTFFIGMRAVGPTKTSLISTLEPVVTVFASALFLSETLAVGSVVGGVLVLTSLLLTVKT